MIRAPVSLQNRLLALVLSLVIGTWLITAALTWSDTRHELDELLDGHLAQAAALLVVQQTSEMGEQEEEVDAPTLHPYAPKVTFQVFHEGRLTLRSVNAPELPLADKGAAFKSGFSTIQLDGQSWRIFATYGSEHDVQVYVGEAMDSRASILWAVLRSTLLPMLLALPLLTVAIWWAVYRGTAPLRRLSQSLSRRQPQDVQAVAVDGMTTEILPMVQSLNDLLARIASLLETERRFTADAAHELRTPIAAIRTQAQVAMEEADDVLRQHALRKTLEGCDRATRLVEQLLTLSRLESGDSLATDRVDLGRVMQQVVAELAPQALHKDQGLSLDAAQVITILGNETLLAVLIRNLVDNAIRYCPAKATIEVTLALDGQQAVLRVCDSGPGLDEVDLGSLGTRFFRVLGNEQSGSGLGWSIACRIADVHHGELRATRCAELGGLAVTLRIPTI